MAPPALPFLPALIIGRPVNLILENFCEFQNSTPDQHIPFTLNPNQTKGGYKVPKAFSNAYNFVYDEIWIITPSCKFIFWCKKSFQIKFWGY